MLGPGDTPTTEHFDRLVWTTYDEDGIRYLKAEDWLPLRAFGEEMRGCVLDLTHPAQRTGGVALTVNTETAPELIDWGLALAVSAGLHQPWHGLIHRDLQLGYHYDTQNPYPCTNLTVVLARDCDGGHLVLPDRRVAFGCRDLRAIIFDGQELHGLLPFRLAPGGYRAAITWYCPKGAEA